MEKPLKKRRLIETQEAPFRFLQLPHELKSIIIAYLANSDTQKDVRALLSVNKCMAEFSLAKKRKNYVVHADRLKNLISFIATYRNIHPLSAALLLNLPASRAWKKNWLLSVTTDIKEKLAVHFVDCLTPLIDDNQKAVYLGINAVKKHEWPWYMDNPTPYRDRDSGCYFNIPPTDQIYIVKVLPDKNIDGMFGALNNYFRYCPKLQLLSLNSKEIPFAKVLIAFDFSKDRSHLQGHFDYPHATLWTTYRYRFTLSLDGNEAECNLVTAI